MAVPRGHIRGLPVQLLTGLAMMVLGTGVALPVLGQDTPTDAPPAAPSAGQASILTLDQDRLFRESAFGRAAVARAETETAALAAENRRIEAALEVEEQDLTTKRPTLAPDDFAPLAEAFDIKVEEIRAAQDAKSRAITRRLEEDRQRFFEAAVPMLGKLLAESGAVAILSDQSIVLSLTSIDVTEVAIARMNTVLPAIPDETAPGPTPDASPQSGTEAPQDAGTAAP